MEFHLLCPETFQSTIKYVFILLYDNPSGAQTGRISDNLVSVSWYPGALCHQGISNKVIDHAG